MDEISDVAPPNGKGGGMVFDSLDHDCELMVTNWRTSQAAVLIFERHDVDDTANSLR